MSRFYILILAMLSCNAALQAQTISLTFTATFNGNHLPLDSIHITNLTQGGDTTLHGTDTVLVLDQGTGTDGGIISHPGQLFLYPVTPNPVTQTATIRLFLPQESMVTLRAHDLPGREIASARQWLPAGYHTFSFTPGKEACYLLSVEALGQQQVQKLVSLAGTGGNAMIAYAGNHGGLNSMKVSLAIFPWAPGDNLRFIGYTSNGMDTIDAQPVQSTLYTFQYQPQLPAPIANFTASDTTVQVNDTVQFIDLSTGNPTSWKWYFGDGDSSLQQSPLHTYNLVGIYSVTLIASNSTDCDTMTKYIFMTVICGGPGIPCPGMPLLYDTNGNIYCTVQIGTQCWMKENLKARNYNNGTTIPNITSISTWTSLSTGARCWYNNDSATYAATYGSLYNWYAVENSSDLCPRGWHVPTDAEWTILTAFLGGLSVAGGPLKETGTTHWSYPNTGATNSSGFTALPGGLRHGLSGSFGTIEGRGYWWSSSASTTSTAYHRELYFSDTMVSRWGNVNKHGFSVRCVRDY
jgi:uncharacterized protein (TIGR02145 family)